LATQAALRYAVRGMWDPVFCSPPCTTEAQQDAARLQSINQVLYTALKRWGIPNSIAVHVSICSNQPGFRFDYTRGVCVPHDTPGIPGYETVVHIAYDHVIGSLLGLRIATLSVQSTQHEPVEVFRNIQFCGSHTCREPPLPTPEWEP
jgi:hypothetical protein